MLCYYVLLGSIIMYMDYYYYVVLYCGYNTVASSIVISVIVP